MPSAETTVPIALLLASGEPVGNPLLPKDDLNGIAPIALQLDVDVSHRSAGAATGLEQFRQSLDLARPSRDVGDHRDHTSRRATFQPNPRASGFALHLRRERLRSGHLAAAGRVRQPSAILCHLSSISRTPSVTLGRNTQPSLRRPDCS